MPRARFIESGKGGNGSVLFGAIGRAILLRSEASPHYYCCSPCCCGTWHLEVPQSNISADTASCPILSPAQIFANANFHSQSDLHAKQLRFMLSAVLITRNANYQFQNNPIETSSSHIKINIKILRLECHLIKEI